MTDSNTLAEVPLDPVATPPAPPAETRPFYWSVRRELWENRSLYLAPVVVAAVVLFASWANMFGLPKKIGAAAGDPVKRHSVIVKSFSMAPAPIMLATLIVGMFYSLDALYGERRDRSILFWKSLPVSDRTTVLSKMSIPILVLPVVALTLSVFTQFMLVLLSTPIMAARGLSPFTVWAEFRFLPELIVMIYGLTVHALWFAPIYAYLMLISAWARRSPFLWAVLPVFAVAAVERIALDTSHFLKLIGYRFSGAMATAFAKQPRGSSGVFERLDQLTPVRFLTTPSLWIGLMFAAACVVAATRLRRNREPI